ncbi:MAG: FAD-dependent oxidoreductase [Bacteroidota bacterium]
MSGSNQRCLIVGASHAGVNCAFALRRHGWEGKIVLYDQAPHLPYHRPPLSKTKLSTATDGGINLLKPADSYEQAGIQLCLGTFVKSIDRVSKTLCLQDGTHSSFDKLVLATGASAFLPPIEGISHPDMADKIFTLRTLDDLRKIQTAFNAPLPSNGENKQKKVAIIGAGFIGLELAATLTQQGASVTVLERENRVLSRVAPPELSEIFEQLHQARGVLIEKNKNVRAIVKNENSLQLQCDDHQNYSADFIVVGTGIRVNAHLAKAAGLVTEKGIHVNGSCQTSDSNIYAIGDVTQYEHPRYDRTLRLESVQNAVDQAKVAAAAICGKTVLYDSLPWFWSDQYEVRLQMVGLSAGYDQLYLRKEKGTDLSVSIWYFKAGQLLAVDAVNNARAYTLATRLIKSGQPVDVQKLTDPNIELKPNTIVLQN